MDALLASIVMVAPRLAVRYAARRPVTNRRGKQRAIIVGAGNLGQMLGGLTVVGSVADLGDAIDTWQATDVIIAVPGAKGAFIRKVVEAAAPHGITPRIVPGVRDIIDGRIDVKALREVAIEDLLRRGRRGNVRLDLHRQGRSAYVRDGVHQAGRRAGGARGRAEHGVGTSSRCDLATCWARAGR